MGNNKSTPVDTNGRILDAQQRLDGVSYTTTTTTVTTTTTKPKPKLVKCN
jgi:hypothetical protein